MNKIPILLTKQDFSVVFFCLSVEFCLEIGLFFLFQKQLNTYYHQVNSLFQICSFGNNCDGDY